MSNFSYLPHTEEEIKEMLKTIGVDSLEELYKDVPQLYKEELNIPKSKSEIEVKREIKEMASLNADISEYGMFRGAGVYNHYIPSLVPQIAGKRSFLTAYTPYQAEVSQGTLQMMFEFQTMIAELTGMEVSNASMYDGASAMAEAILMSARVNKKNKTLIAETIHPEYMEVAKTYVEPQGFSIETIKHTDSGKIDINDLKSKLNDDINSVIIGYPNFYGVIENIKKIKEILPQKVMLIVVANPMALGILEAPGKLGADIVVGDGQPLGNPMAFGGPSFGFFAVNKKDVRKMPGRIIGETVDEDGKRAFAMILQTREQHIRRAKATSNICSNHAHNTLLASIYMTIMGKEGFSEVSEQNYHKAHYLAKKLIETEKFEMAFSGEFFNEFVVKSKIPVDELNKKLFEEKMIGPLHLTKFYKEKENYALFCATELTTKEDIDYLVSFVEGLI
ncbi:putative glycine dehydrogenase (decarboxylating) subunit 1 [Tepiditoga spiralis]|uniref:Probable glycine dehydrogenase (decarboxylating) subunit 1 n=1 Tax=Tepiditoga spiralis TaxID=2108365 RepID=A0A7G1G5H2_9BACT|nr:aminomethyl-transferring glycine dehydrogenase subunit GcvPA [Tepiditoga spiralis]BBE31365.1 putative glycine dehydrogenase (decarboxylating) subunit 1 [Tepiditoga spiralis]